MTTVIRRQIDATVRERTRADLRRYDFALSPEDYDAILLEPLLLPQIEEIGEPALSSELALKTVHAVVSQIVCKQWIVEFKQLRFTECGGMLMRRLVRVLASLLRERCDALKTLEWMSLLVSVPSGIADTDSILKNTGCTLSAAEVASIRKQCVSWSVSSRNGSVVVVLSSMRTYHRIIHQTAQSTLHLSISSLLYHIDTHRLGRVDNL